MDMAFSPDFYVIGKLIPVSRGPRHVTPQYVSHGFHGFNEPVAELAPPELVRHGCCYCGPGLRIDMCMNTFVGKDAEFLVLEKQEQHDAGPVCCTGHTQGFKLPTGYVFDGHLPLLARATLTYLHSDLSRSLPFGRRDWMCDLIEIVGSEILFDEVHNRIITTGRSCEYL